MTPFSEGKTGANGEDLGSSAGSGNHLDYYRYQAVARGIHGPGEIRAQTEIMRSLYRRIPGRWLPAPPQSAIADLACGHGTFLYWLKTEDYENAVGVDSAPVQVGHARSAGLSVHEEGVAEWLKRQRSEWDVLVAMDFIEHISKDALMLFLGGTYAALKPGGKLILRYPNGDSPLVGLNLFNDITHVWTYTTNCLTSLARMHGYKSILFQDEGVEVIRDHRWIKIPIALLSRFILTNLVRWSSREKIKFWNSSIWACLEK